MRIVWDKLGERLYETGTDHGVLYPQDKLGTYPKGVAWNGLIGVSEAPTGAEANAKFADNIKYLNLLSNEEFAATIEAYTYPDEFAVCDGSVEPEPGVIVGQQPRRTFGFAYRTLVGNDTEGTELGYKLHLVYGALASPSAKAYGTINESPDAVTFSWEVTTTPVAIDGLKPTATLVIDSTKVDAAKLKAFETVLYGVDADEEGSVTAVPARLPLPDEVISLLKVAQG